MRIGIIFSCAIWLAVAMWLSSCGPILGIKRYQSGDTTIDFITGYDFGIGANGVDTVEDRRGIMPADHTGMRVIEAKK